ncbi:hypothetical protein PPACK8108_LOCUS25385 [Phakopsora pachyrhizi]|uniref:Uncharacterized protein n=1 Tax=Phakopsora pachyrhizi TaxID=170000 RepID=A0AAV0BRU3_PHAPC|nr:hypothetical protein PPACK8108_LOCUS25385 [Phakopsora pachyrhizi]
MTSSTGAFQGKLWKICVVDLQQGLAWLCWAGELSPRQVGQAGAARAQLGLAGSRAGRANGPLAWLGQNGQAGAWLWAGKAGWGRLRLGYGQAGARLWAGKAGWGRLGLGYGHVRQAEARLWAGRLGLGYGQAGARLWAGKAGKAGWGRLWLGPNGQAVARSNGQAGARLWAGKAGWGRLWLGPNGQAVARLGLGPNGQGPLAWLGQNGQAGAGLWAGKAGWGRLGLGYGQAWLWAGKADWGRLRLGYGQAVARSKWAGWGRLGLGYGQVRKAGAGCGSLGAESWEVDLKITRTDALRHVVDQNSTGVDRRAGNGLVDGGVNLGIKNLKQHKVIARERGKGQLDRRAGHTHTQAEGNRATESIKTEGRPTEDYTRRKIEIPTGGAFRGGFAGRAGQGSAQLGFAGLGPRQVGQPGLDSAWLGQGQVGQTGRLGWVLDNLGSLAGGRFDLQKPDKNGTSTNSSCPRTPKMEKKPKKEKPPGIEENPPKGKTPPGKETSVKDGFKGKTPLAGKGNTVNFE